MQLPALGMPLSSNLELHAPNLFGNRGCRLQLVILLAIRVGLTTGFT